MPNHPLHGQGFGVVGTITPLVDLWLNERRLTLLPLGFEWMQATYFAGWD